MGISFVAEQLKGVVRQGRGVVRDGKRALGIPSHLRNDDRRVLEQVIFPYFVERPEFPTVLFVGTAWYTEPYNQVFREKTYSTIEIDPSQAQYGSSNHIVDSLEYVDRHFAPRSLNLIICNGVFGWGLDEKSSVEKAFAHCYDLLRSGGIFMVGWNDVPEHRPFSLEDCEALKLFQPWEFPPLGTTQYQTPSKNRHTFNFYIKSDSVVWH
jgi:SAM-dependent methyltransferase